VLPRVEHRKGRAHRRVVDSTHRDLGERVVVIFRESLDSGRLQMIVRIVTRGFEPVFAMLPSDGPRDVVATDEVVQQRPVLDQARGRPLAFDVSERHHGGSLPPLDDVATVAEAVDQLGT
jgi:hypothetical protein